MAKDDKDPKTEEGGEESGGSGKPLLLILIIVLLLSNVGLTAFFMLGSGAEADEAPAEEVGPITPMQPFVINLDEPKADRYLRVTMSMEIGEEGDMEMLEMRRPIIRHRFIAHLGQQQIATLRTPESKERLQEELTLIAQEIMTERSVRNIYFTDFIIQ